MTQIEVLSEPRVLQLGIPHEILDPLRRWAMENFGYFRPNRPWRQYGVIDELTLLGVGPPEEWEIVRLMAAGAAGIPHDLPQEPLLGHFCGMIFHAGSVHKHRDAGIPNKVITRTNVMIQASPGGGGTPMIENIGYNVRTGDAWVFHPDRMTHWTTWVEGGPRIIMSYGYVSDK